MSYTSFEVLQLVYNILILRCKKIYKLTFTKILMYILFMLVKIAV